MPEPLATTKPDFRGFPCPALNDPAFSRILPPRP